MLAKNMLVFYLHVRLEMKADKTALKIEDFFKFLFASLKNKLYF